MDTIPIIYTYKLVMRAIASFTVSLDVNYDPTLRVGS